jgi:hypothetical protein
MNSPQRHKVNKGHKEEDLKGRKRQKNYAWFFVFFFPFLILLCVLR